MSYAFFQYSNNSIELRDRSPDKTGGLFWFCILKITLQPNRYGPAHEILILLATCVKTGHPDKSVKLKIIFLISQPNGSFEHPKQ